MSDGIMILLVFVLIALLGGGTVVRFRRGGIDRPASVRVRYEVGGKTCECRETVKLRSGPIMVCPVPIGQCKTSKIATRVGSQVLVAYLPSDPSKAIPADNTGLMNE